MVGDIKSDVEIKDIQEVFGLDEESAKKFVEVHDAYVSQLIELEPRVAITLTLSTAMAFAGTGEVSPPEFIEMVKNLMAGLVYDVNSAPTTEA